MAQRNAALDKLRGVALLLVLGRHAPVPGDDEPVWVRVLMSLWIDVGWVGVDLFFVLSGYLVAGLLFRELREHAEVSTGRFLMRRGFKIYPAFYVMLGGTLWARDCLGVSTPDSQIVSEFVFLQSYLNGIWNHTWSLAVEEHFYLGLAVVFAVLASARPREVPGARAMLLAYVLVAVACLCLRLHVTEVAPFKLLTHFFASHLRIDTLCFGVWLSYLDVFHDGALERFVARARLPLGLASVALLSVPLMVPLRADHAFVFTWGLTLVAWGAGGLLLVARHGRADQRRSMHWLARVGVDSYSIYLWHMAVLTWLVQPAMAVLAPTVPYIVFLVLYVLSSLLFGAGAARVIEMPALRLRERLAPARRSRGQAAGAGVAPPVS